jgi:hypothetical protein
VQLINNFDGYTTGSRGRGTRSMPARHAAGAPLVNAYRSGQEAHAKPGRPLPPGVAAGTPLHAAMSAVRRVLLTAPVEPDRHSPTFCAARLTAFQERVGWPLEVGAYQPPPGAPRLIVVGTGGGGMTFTTGTLHNALWPYGWSANMADANFSDVPLAAYWKHRRARIDDSDLLACYGATRILYVLSDPLMAVASTGRRANDGRPTLANEAESVMSTLSGAGSEQSVGGRVMSRLSHLHTWLAMQPPCPVLFADLDALTGNHRLLADFFSVPVDAMAGFRLHERLTADPRAGLPAEFVDLAGAVHDQILAFELTIRLPSNYVDVPALAAGPLARAREPLPREAQQVTDVPSFVSFMLPSREELARRAVPSKSATNDTNARP